jgi:hypothetical protein
MDFGPIKENSGNFPIFRKNNCLVGHFFIITCGLDKSSPYTQCGSDESNPHYKIGLDESSPYNFILV